MATSPDPEITKDAGKMVLFKNISAVVLILVILIGIIALVWQWLQEQPLLVQFIGVVVTVLLGVWPILIGKPLTPGKQSILWKFITDYRTMVGLMVLATLLWTWYFGNVINHSPLGPGATTPVSSTAPAASSGDETTTAGASSDNAPGLFKVEDVCAATENFDSELTTKSHLEERAWAIARAHYGEDSAVRMATVPQFMSGRNLAEICIAVTFRSEAPSQ